MPKARQQFEPYVESVLQRECPEIVGPLMEAVDAFDAFEERGERTQENLDKIIAAVSSDRIPLYENACGFMWRLGGKWPEANAAIVEMSKSPKEHVRFNAIVCLGHRTPSDIVDSVLRSGLLDKSSRVRGKAADSAGRLAAERLIPELEAALAAENDDETRSTIEFELRLSRDGYVLEQLADGSYSVTVRADGGVLGVIIAETRLRAEGIEAIVRGLTTGETSRLTRIGQRAIDRLSQEIGDS